MSVNDLEEIFPHYDHTEFEKILEEVHFDLEKAANYVMNKIIHDLDYELCRNISDVEQEKQFWCRFQSKSKVSNGSILSKLNGRLDKLDAMRKRLVKHSSRKALKEYTVPLVVTD
tara:strand:- start:943 stop:1287 length:345 start_codon:yes stop_codon:yes gene_type:complete